MISESARPKAQIGSRPWLWARRVGRLALALTSLAFLTLAAIIVVTAALPLFGYRTTVIYGGSMEPTIGRGAVVISRPVDVEALAVGDVITFRRLKSETKVTHRIVAIRQENGQRSFTVKGDANASPDASEITFDGQVDKMVKAVPYIGYVVAFGRSIQGVLLLLVVPALGLALLKLLDMGQARQGKERLHI